MTHRAWLVCHADLNLARPTTEIVPGVFTDNPDVVEIGCKFDPAHKYIVAHVVGQAIAPNLGFIGTQIALYGDLRVPGHVTDPAESQRGCMHERGGDSQLCLIHVERFLELTTQSSDQHLIDIELHDEIREPPALCTLDAVSGAVPLGKTLLHDAGGRD